MRPKKTFYVWQCSHCDHRNKEVFNFHYDFPSTLHSTWICSGCGNESYITLQFRVYPITEKKDESYYENRSYYY